MTFNLKLVLLKTQLCKYLDSNEVDVLLGYLKLIEFPSQAVILQQGKPSDGAYIIINGKALVTAKLTGAGIIQITEVASGNFVGNVSLLENAVNTVSITAEMTTECIFIPKAYFQMVGLFSPETKYKINRAVVEDNVARLHGMHAKITALLAETQMTSISTSIFNEVMHSLTRPREISLTTAGVSLEQLKKLEFYRELNDADLAVLLQHAVLCEASRHCTLIKDGEKDSSCYLILRGAVQSRVKESHKLAKLSVLSPYAIFCSTSFIDGAAGILDFTTCERTLFFKISAANLTALQNSNSLLWHYLYEAICKSFASLGQAANRLEVRLNSELYNR